MQLEASCRSRPSCAGAPGLVVHAANSAATLREPASHFDLVRCGIAIYGCDPMNQDPRRPRTRAGARAELLRGRGQAGPRRARAPDTAGGSSPSATPGSPRCRSATPTASGGRSSNNCDVLIGGRRYPLVGTVSMDNMTVDLGPDGRRSGSGRARATLIGRDGSRAPDRRGTGPRGSARSPTRSVRDLGSGAARATTATGSPCRERPAPGARPAMARPRAWLVGGAPRDRLLGRPTSDFDVVVAGRAGGGRPRARSGARRGGLRVRAV